MDRFITDLSILLVAAGVLSVLAMLLRQPVIVAYILSGAIIGPGMLGWIEGVHFIEVVSHLGITLLLFIAGLNLHPQKLIALFRKTTLVTAANCLVSFVIAFVAALFMGFGIIECLCVGLALMYSSTILVVKLLPTTQLHHERMGAACIGVLIMQDLLAVGALAFIRCLGTAANPVLSFAVLTVKLIAFISVLFLIEQFVLHRVMKRVDRLHEVLFVLGLAWCFGIAKMSYSMGLFYESGAFFAGVVLARQPISRFIADKFRPLRDFFLVLFFFSMGARLDISMLHGIILPAAVLAAVLMVVKPVVFEKAFQYAGETRKFSREAGFRLGQLSEFSLLVAFLAMELRLISLEASQYIQLTTILTFIVSSYLVVYKYPTPIGVEDDLMKD
ncbi:MAG: cation:proton antiporter [Candidatus Omnitrophica bacterium]|nr:cation:proton antiporter [Candidatus Omnitrophota bacterium]